MARRDEDDHERIAAIRQQLISLAEELQRLEAKYADDEDDNPRRRPRFELIRGGLAATVAASASAVALMRSHPQRVIAASTAIGVAAAVAVVLMPMYHSTAPDTASVPPNIVFSVPSRRPGSSAPAPTFVPTPQPTSAPPTAPTAGPAVVPAAARPTSIPPALVMPTRTPASVPTAPVAPIPPSTPLLPSRPWTPWTSRTPASPSASPCLGRIELPGLLDVCVA